MWRSIAVFCFAVLAAGAQTTIKAESGPWTATLDRTWLWHSGDNMRWASATFDDSKWSLLPVPGSLPGASHYWVRIHLESGPTSNPGLLLGPLAYAYDVYWDGRPIGHFGDLSRGTWFMPRWQTFHLPREMTKPGAHAIAIRIAQNGAGIGFPSRKPRVGVGENRIGELPALYDAKSAQMSADFQPRLLELLVAFGFLLASFYFFLLPPSVSEGDAFRWLGVILLGRALFVACEFYWNFGPLDIPGNVLVFSWAFVSLSLVGMIEFPYALFRRRVPLALRCAECLLALLLAAPAPIPYSAIFLRFAIFLIPAAVAITLAAFELQKRTAEARFTLVLFGIFGLAALNNVLAIGYNIGLPYIIYIGGFWLWSWDVVYLLWVPAIAVQIHKTNLRFRDERERMRGEMEAARHVQEVLLPSRVLHVPGFEIDTAYQPATEVGGDFFQLFSASDDALLVVLGDVSGKGMKAALLVSVIVGALRNRRSDSPAEILSQLNSVLLGGSDGGFTTCCCALFTEEGTVRLASAGHLAPYRNGDEIEIAPGLPLAIVAGAEWQETQIVLQPGDRLLWVSDGVIEARSGGHLLGFHRAQELATRSTSEIALAAQQFGQEDDITVVSVTRQRVSVYAT